QTVGEAYHDYSAGLTRQTVEPLLDEVFDPGAWPERGRPARTEAGGTPALQPCELLDIASGPGYVAALAEERGAKVTGVDFSSLMVRMAQETYPTIKFIEGDAEALPFEDDE